MFQLLGPWQKVKHFIHFSNIKRLFYRNWHKSSAKLLPQRHESRHLCTFESKSFQWTFLLSFGIRWLFKIFGYAFGGKSALNFINQLQFLRQIMQLQAIFCIIQENRLMLYGSWFLARWRWFKMKKLWQFWVKETYLAMNFGKRHVRVNQ